MHPEAPCGSGPPLGQKAPLGAAGVPRKVPAVSPAAAGLCQGESVPLRFAREHCARRAKGWAAWGPGPLPQTRAACACLGAPPELIVVIAPPLPHVPLSTTCKASLSTRPCPAHGSPWGSATSLLFLQFALTKTKVGIFLCCCPALPCPGPAEVKPAGAQPVFLLSSPGAEHPQTHL